MSDKALKLAAAFVCENIHGDFDWQSLSASIRDNACYIYRENLSDSALCNLFILATGELKPSQMRELFSKPPTHYTHSLWIKIWSEVEQRLETDLADILLPMLEAKIECMAVDAAMEERAGV